MADRKTILGKRTIVRMTSDMHIGKATPTSRREMDQASLALAWDHVDDAKRIMDRVASRLTCGRDVIRVLEEMGQLQTVRNRLKELAEWLDSSAAEREELCTPPAKPGTTTVVSLGDALEPPERAADNL